MSNRIFKYKLEPASPKELDDHTAHVDCMEGSQFFTVMSQGEGLFIYAIVPDGVATVERRTFEVVPTGRTFVDVEHVERRYVGSAQMPASGFVFHVFELTVKEGV